MQQGYKDQSNALLNRHWCPVHLKNLSSLSRDFLDSPCCHFPFELLWEFRVSLCGPTVVNTAPPPSLQVVGVDSRIPGYLPECKRSDDREDNADFNLRTLAGSRLHILNFEAIGPLLKSGGLLRLSRGPSNRLRGQVPLCGRKSWAAKQNSPCTGLALIWQLSVILTVGSWWQRARLGHWWLN